MANFYPLSVAAIDRETRDAVAVTLVPDHNDAEHFKFTQGQYLTLKRMFEGQEIRRSYSICAAPYEGHLKVGIKKVEGGCFSSWANDGLKVGDLIDAMPPAGNFHVPLAPDQNRHYLGFAGGSGITPILSIIKTVLLREPTASFTLVYANRSANTIMFREALEDVKNTHMDRLSIIHILESENDLDLFAGRIDDKKMDALLAGWINIDFVDIAFICGPEPMMKTISSALANAGIPKKNIKFELFGAPQKGRAAQQVQTAKDGLVDSECEATITVDGVTRSIAMPMVGQSILEAAIGADLGAPFSCKAGVCSTCRAKVIEGETEMLANYALEDYEVERGYVLACQCYPISDKVIVDFDQ